MDRPAPNPDARAPLQDLEARCREHGIPLTIQRRAVLAALASREDHPTADQVYQAVQADLPSISRATTYRVLDTLVALGLVVRVSHPDSVARYDAKTYRHHHLLCDVCGAMVDIEPANLPDVALPDLSAAGIRVREVSLQLSGLCARCALETPGSAAPGPADSPRRNP
ncbi:MAG: transcriptional repressor [Planctomycetes bacterium]|nr:transcriptional repressor [Planctomycetota bacterium]